MFGSSPVAGLSADNMHPVLLLSSCVSLANDCLQDGAVYVEEKNGTLVRLNLMNLVPRPSMPSPCYCQVLNAGFKECGAGGRCQERSMG